MHIPTVPLSSGRQIPAVGLGTWQLKESTVKSVQHALEHCYQLIDTSSDYGTQPGIGAAIREAEVQRSDLYITTKVEETDDAYDRTQRNLAELGLEYLNLTLIHRPPETGAGNQLWQELIRSRADGLTQDIGVSNYSIPLIEELIVASGVVPAVNQVEWSPFGHSRELLEYCRENEILVQAYSPLTRGKRLDDDRLAKIASAYEKSPAQVLIRWNIQLGVVPLPKANGQDHQLENLAVFDFELSGSHMQQLHDLNEHYSALESLPYI